MSDRKEFVLLKRGLYHRPDGNGYTGLLREAGLYSLNEASRAHCAYMINQTTKAVTEYMKHCDAPEFAPDCCSEVKMREITATLTEQAAEIERLRDYLEELRDYKPDIHSGRTSQDPRDDVPDVIEADVFLTFQEDAATALGEKP